MHKQNNIYYFMFVIVVVIQTTQTTEFSAEVGETSSSAEDASLEDRILTPEIGNDMLNHKNPAITNNELKELWEKLPEYELTDIK